jgi:SAM-dependent methyltransferase
MQLQLTPLQADPVYLGIENGSRIWGASTIDPAFTARLPQGSPPLEAGWYKASVVIDGRSGEVRGPRLYLPDAGGAYSEERTVDMAREGAAYTAEFFLASPVEHVRFDPSTTRCEFACDGLQISPIDGAKARAAKASSTQSRSRVAPWLARAVGAWRRLAAAPIPVPGVARPMGRKDRVLAGIDRNGLGIEIGPSHDPIAPKSEGFKVQVIDHASREELLQKYATHNLSLDRIEEVDFVWRGQSYLELTGRPKHYDWIIASHLIEHTPDLISFLADCESILKDDGVLSLVIPDKRYAFDRFRPITGLARVIDCHLAGQKIHSAGAAAEYFMNVASKANLLCWDAVMPGDYAFIHSAQQARDMMREIREKGSYLDIHNWCFVPHSFRLLMADLYTLGYTKLREVTFHPTQGCEFYVTMGRHGTGPPASRLEILRAIDAELAASDATG